jgi:hypothetical protein
MKFYGIADEILKQLDELNLIALTMGNGSCVIARRFSRPVSLSRASQN